MGIIPAPSLHRKTQNAGLFKLIILIYTGRVFGVKGIKYTVL